MEKEGIKGKTTGVIPKKLTYSIVLNEHKTSAIKEIQSHGSKLPKLNKKQLKLRKIKNKFIDIGNLFIGKLPKKMSWNERIKNSAYLSKINHIHIAKDQQVAIFHELGHATNAVGKNSDKYIQELNHFSKGLAIPLVVTTALLSTTPKEKRKNTLQKSLGFASDNVGFLTAAVFSPVLIEEAKASSKAIKFINKSNLSEAAKKSHNKSLKLAYATYLGGAASMALISTSTVKIKNKVVQKLENI